MIATVIRQLTGFRPATLCIIEHPGCDTSGCDVRDEYDVKEVLEELAQDEIRKFKAKFAEFEAATFYIEYNVPFIRDGLLQMVRRL